MCIVKLRTVIASEVLFGCSFVDESGKQLISSDDTGNSVELGSGGSELIITRRNNDGRSVRTLGSREFLRYYRQKLRPTRTNDVAISAALAARYVLTCSKVSISSPSSILNRHLSKTPFPSLPGTEAWVLQLCSQESKWLS